MACGFAMLARRRMRGKSYECCLDPNGHRKLCDKNDFSGCLACQNAPMPSPTLENNADLPLRHPYPHTSSTPQSPSPCICRLRRPAGRTLAAVSVPTPPCTSRTCGVHTCTYSHRVTRSAERDRETCNALTPSSHPQTKRQTDRQTDTQTDRHTDRAKREREKEKGKQERKTQRNKERQKERRMAQLMSQSLG